MKYIFIFWTFVICPFQHYTFGQQREIFTKPIEISKYTATYQLSVSTTTSNFQDMYILLIGSGHTLFMAAERLEMDSLLYNSNDINVMSNIIGGKSGVPKSKILIDRGQGIVYNIDQPVTEPLFYPEEIELNWQILSEIKKIANLTCQKATTHLAGRNYIAWFSQNVPLPVGPHKFFGLPGIIVSIEDSEAKFKFEMTSFSKCSSERWIHLYQKRIPTKTTQIEMRSLVVALFRNPEMIMKSIPGVTISEDFYKNLQPRQVPEFMEIIE